MPETEYLTDAVVRLERAVTNIGMMRLRPWGISLSGYAAMKILEKQPQLSLAQLSRRCFVKPQTMTRIVSELERRGWVERGPHAESERAISLTLSAEGAVALGEMAAEVDRIESTLGEVVGGGGVAELAQTLRRCAIAVEGQIAQQRKG